MADNTNYAFFNYSPTYSGTNGISGFLSATAHSKDWLRIFISPDTTGGGHFITHGIDFGASYTNGARGLVPANSGTLTKTFLRGDGWSALWSQTAQDAAAGSGTSAQQQANIESYLQSTLVSAYDIKQWINQSFSANDAMRFKGTITVSDSNAISNTTTAGTNNGFPASCEVGDTYKVTNTQNKELAGQNVNTGDLLICIKDGTGNNINSSTYWTVVQSNVEHLTAYTINGTAYYVYAQSASGATIVAPTTFGTQGQVLVSGGNNTAPSWVNAGTLVVAEAAKVTYALNKGTGLSFTTSGSSAANTYDGSQTITIALLAATSSQLGGVKIDAGTHSPLYDGTNAPTTYKPTVSVNNGEIYLTAENIKNALGYVPGNANGQVTGIVIANSASSINMATSQTNPYINIKDGTSVLGSFRLSGSGKISVAQSNNTSTVVVSLGAADSSDYGGIKLGYTQSGKNYAVALDENGKAYVNVPWVSDVFTDSANGLVPMSSTANKQTNNTDNVASNTTFFLGADAKWYKLPASSFQGDRRIVQLAGTNIITAASGNALNVVAGSHMTITAEQSSGSYTGKLTFAAVWRDVQIRKITGTTIGTTPTTVGQNDPIVFDNSESVFMLGEEVTSGGTTKTVVKSYMTWYNLDDGSYELV